MARPIEKKIEVVVLEAFNALSNIVDAFFGEK
ncbi:hypothetical protein SAMN05414139_10156 [Burkholderia sp. D7]|nr:hypothetical protein SAMN05414139_10156 [Burkholderia sp. D7]